MTVKELKEALDKFPDESYLEANIDISFVSESKNNKFTIKVGHVTGLETYKEGYNDVLHVGLICRENNEEY